MARFQRSTAETSVREAADWRDSAACRGLYDQFTPPDGETTPERHLREPYAKRICWTECTVRESCLEDALERKDEINVAGGLDPEERRLLARRMNRPSQAGRAAG